MLTCHWDERVFREETEALRTFAGTTAALVVCSDFSQPQRTIATMVEARRRGQSIALYPFLRDPVEGVVEKVAGAIAASSSEAQRFAQISAMRENKLHVNDRPLAEAAAYHEPQLRAAVLAAKLADVLLFFTAAEKRRWTSLIQKPVRRFRYLPAPSIPFAGPQNGKIAVYAPDADVSQLAFAAMALQERRMSAQFITAESANVPLTASTVIVPAWWRPARVAALAAKGYAVVAPDAGGPDERSSCRTYGGLDAFALGAAVDAAQSERDTGLYFSPASDALSIDEALPQVEGARVSVIVRTYDRPQLLARALRSIAAQTHGDVEIVVVNNGGPDVRAAIDASCGGRPYRYVVLDRREKISAASNAGIHAASGAYIAYLDDDDLLYPDHLARALDALVRSGADIAYTNCLAEYARVSGEERTVFGYQIFRDNEFVAKDMYVDNVAPIHSIVHRKDIVEKYGYFDESLPVTDDWEMWLKVSRGARFIHVDRVTCEYSWRVDPDRGNMTLTHQSDFAESYQTITARYAADVEGLAAIRGRQQQVIDARLRQAEELPRVDPRRVAELTIEAMSKDAVPAEPVADPFA